MFLRGWVETFLKCCPCRLAHHHGMFYCTSSSKQFPFTLTLFCQWPYYCWKLSCRPLPTSSVSETAVIRVTDIWIDWKCRNIFYCPWKCSQFLDHCSLCQQWIFSSCSSWVEFQCKRHLYTQMHMHACMQFMSELSCRITWHVSCDKPVILVTSWIICLWSSWMTLEHGQCSTARKPRLPPWCSSCWLSCILQLKSWRIPMSFSLKHKPSIFTNLYIWAKF